MIKSANRGKKRKTRRSLKRTRNIMNPKACMRRIRKKRKTMKKSVSRKKKKKIKNCMKNLRS